MDNLLLVSNLILWVSILGLALLVYALTRQVASLHDRIAPAGALTINNALRVGDPAPLVEVRDLGGRMLSLGGAGSAQKNSKSTLLFFLATDCPISRTLLPVLGSITKSEPWVDVVLASDGGTAAQHEKFVADQGLGDFSYVHSRLLGETYGVGKVPYAVLIGEEGHIAALGLVNSREHLESLFEAKERKIGSLQEYVQRTAPEFFYNANSGGIDR